MLANIFAQLYITLRQKGLKTSIASTIHITAKASHGTVDELKVALDKSMREGSPKGLLQKFKSQGRRACYPFRASTISGLIELIDDLKYDLRLAIDILSL